MHFFMVRISNMVRTLTDRNSVSGSRLKNKPEKQQIELHKRYLFPYLQAFLEALFMSSAWALSLCSINHCYRYIRSQCPFQSAQICSKFLLLSIFMRFLSRAEPPRKTCWSWLYKYLQIIHKGKKYQNRDKLKFPHNNLPAGTASHSVGQSVNGSHLIK